MTAMSRRQQHRRARHGARWYRRAAIGAALLLVSASATVASVVVLPSAAPPAAAAPVTFPPCPTGTADGIGGCVVTLPCPPQPIVCNTSAPPTVDIGPVSELQDGQYVTVTTTNFPNSGFPDGATGGAIRVALCSTNSTSSPNPANPNCLFGNYEGHDFDPEINEDINGGIANDQTAVSLPVFYEPQGGGNASIPGQPFTGPFSGPSQPFFCDNSANPCAVEVTWEEQNNPTGTNAGPGQTADPYVSSTNTVTMPLEYAPLAGGCPSSDVVFNTESPDSFLHFVDPAVGATCAQSNG
ncbi:MAG: hypothetical protein JO368_01855, partial [Acidimicrobiales bacterium]|nr:hypothetical protein [Acidimicrobiales bacterium]